MAPGPASTVSAMLIAAGSFLGGPTFYDMVSQQSSSAVPATEVSKAEKYAAQLAEASQEFLSSLQSGVGSLHESMVTVAEHYAPGLLESAQKSLLQVRAELDVLQGKLADVDLATAWPAVAVAACLLIALLGLVVMGRKKSSKKSEPVELSTLPAEAAAQSASGDQGEVLEEKAEVAESTDKEKPEGAEGKVE